MPQARNEERSLVASLARDDNEKPEGNGRGTAGNDRATAVRLVGRSVVEGNEERSLVASLARDDNEKLKGNGRATSFCRDDNEMQRHVHPLKGMR